MENKLYFTDNYHKIIVDNNTDIERPLSIKEITLFTNLLKDIMPYGYIINPNIVKDNIAYNFINNIYKKHICCNYNSTFYNALQDVIQKDRIEILIDQLLHYDTTYGMNNDKNEQSYIPNKDYITNVELINNELNIDLSNYKYLDICNENDAYQIAINNITTNVALSKDNLDCLIGIIKDYTKKYNININYNWIENNVKNREAKIRLFDGLEFKPTNAPIDLLRLLVYKFTGSSEVINSKETLLNIVNSNCNLNLEDYLNESDLCSLSSIYHRFHKIFLMMKKTGSKNASIINKISRLSKKYHKPFQANFFEKCMDKNYALEMGKNIELLTKEQVMQYIDDLVFSLQQNDNFNNFKAIKIYNACYYNYINNSQYNYYKIRNGKVWIKPNECVSDYPQDVHTRNKYYYLLSEVMRKYIQYNIKMYALRNNIKYIKINNILDIAMPTSEKNFIGTLPEFSTIDLSKSHSNMIGVYWRNEWGTKDFDLSFFDIDNNKIGWNGNYYNRNTNDVNNIHVFSGDMTCAAPEATEIHYFASDNNKYTSGVFYNNRFCGSNGSKFKMFFSQKKLNDNASFKSTKSASKHCWLPSTSEILFESMMESTKQEQVVGVISNSNKFAFTNMILTNDQVSGFENIINANEMIVNIVDSKISSNLYLNDVLYDMAWDDNCPFTILDDFSSDTEIENAENEAKQNEDSNILDFTLKAINKDTLLNILK